MATLTFNDYLNIINNSSIFRQRIKLELLHYSDLKPYSIITSDIVNGSGQLVAERKNGVRKTISCDIINSTISQIGKYIPDLRNNILTPRTPIKLYLGLADENGNEYFISQGIFFLVTPTISSNFAESIVSLELIDAFGLFDGTIGGELNNTYIINVGTNIYDALNGILQTENFYPLPCILDSSFASEVTPYTITKEAGSGTYADIMIELAFMLSANIYFNNEGQLVFEKDVNDGVKASVFDFTTENAQYQGATNRYNYQDFYNVVLIVGSNVNGDIYTYEAIDENLMSLTSVSNVGFKRTKRIEDPNISSNTQAEDRGNFELKRCVAIQNEVSISCIPFFYHLLPDQVCTLTDSHFGFNKERLLINGYTIPFDINSQMTLNVVRAIDLPFNDV